MYQDPEMYRRHLTSRTWHAIRHRPLYRNILYAAVVFLFLYGLRRSMVLQDHALLVDDEPSEHVDLPSHIWAETASQVTGAFQHAYHGYEQYAAPKDELLPLTNGSVNNFNGWGVSAFDSLDTMLIMGLETEFDRTLPMVKQANFSLPEKQFVPYFETIIRYLGGLLSAYALSHNRILLERADELATKLDPVFKTNSGLPLYGVDVASGATTGPQIGILAEMASLQLEYTYLAKLTGKSEHFMRASNIMHVLYATSLGHTGGMLPVRWNLTTGQPYDSHLSVGAQADSAHEYLLKQYLMTAKTDKASLEMYIRATSHIITNLLYISPTRHLLYVTDATVGIKGVNHRPSHIFEHLSCFLPGLLALGAHLLPLNSLDSLGISPHGSSGDGLSGEANKNYETLAGYDLKKIHLWAAEGLAQTCWLTYADQPTGLGPDEIVMKTMDREKKWDPSGNQWRKDSDGYLWIDAMRRWKQSGSRHSPPGVGDKKPVIYTEKERLSGRGRGRDYTIKKAGYLLRPETIESLYILWRVTGDSKWRVRGRRIFQAIEKHTKTSSGYASLRSVEVCPAPKDNSMPSYFLAETLKYLYLMFIDEDPIPLDEWVFNTEAHPFPVFEWTLNERHQFNI